MYVRQIKKEFYKMLKFKENVWFISDVHYGHKHSFVLNPRGYKDVEEAMTKQVESWNNTINNNDIVFHLGDFIVGAGGDIDFAKNFLSKLNFKKLYIIWGNHNACIYPWYKQLVYEQFRFDTLEVYPFTHERITFLGHYAEIEVRKQQINLMHYPIESWNRMSKGSWMLHGHCHCNHSHGSSTLKNRLDVSWEYAGRPVSYEEIKKSFSAGS